MAPNDADDEHEEPAYREPLPQDDRLWRHPSELSTDRGKRSGVGKLLSSLFPRHRP